MIGIESTDRRIEELPNGYFFKSTDTFRFNTKTASFVIKLDDDVLDRKFST